MTDVHAYEQVPVAQAGEAGFGDYVALMKPRVMSLVVFTALVGLLVAPVPVHPVIALAAILLAAEPRFETEVLPLLTKAGCNAGACHGAAAGRGGLKLSLFAGNPPGDYDALVRELEGRRINRTKPADSLFIAKPTGMIDHEGGVRFDFDGPEAKLLADWVAAGAPRSAGASSPWPRSARARPPIRRARRNCHHSGRRCAPCRCGCRS